MTQDKKLIKFTKKPAKQGEDYVVIIPRLYIRNDLINPQKTYNIYFEEIEYLENIPK